MSDEKENGSSLVVSENRSLTKGSTQLVRRGLESLAGLDVAVVQRPSVLVADLGGGTTLEFVLIPPGTFMMGSENGNADEKPVHEVTISTGFYMGKYAVTQGQWHAVMGTTVRQQRDKAWYIVNTTKKISPLLGEGDTYPMYYVSWDEAQEFIQTLNEMNDGFTYRLATEAEWEYACRAGTTGDYAGTLDAMAWYGNNSGEHYQDAPEIWHTGDYKRLDANGNQTHPVGTKQPNAFGLYDMHGNVWEWCEDWYHETYYGAPTDGSAWLSGDEQYFRVLRGGYCQCSADFTRSAVRACDVPEGRVLHSPGFRVVAEVRIQADLPTELP